MQLHWNLRSDPARTADAFPATPRRRAGRPGALPAAALASNIHIGDVFCDDFGNAGRCLDTVGSGGAANDDLDVVFTGGGVPAFGFALNALDVAWTITTSGVGDVLLGSYVVDSQSPGLTGNARRGDFGATEGVAIQSFRIRSTGSDRALIDDFAYVPVPEPGAAMLVGLGLAWLTGSRSAGRAGRA